MKSKTMTQKDFKLRGTFTVKKTELSAAVINGKFIKLRIVDYNVPAKGFFKKLDSAPHELFYTIQTEPFGWEVGRNIKDLGILRKRLLVMHPDTIVPAIPETNPCYDKFPVNKQRKCADQVILFLEACLRSETLRSNSFLQSFL
jgi:hypothetical protein